MFDLEAISFVCVFRGNFEHAFLHFRTFCVTRVHAKATVFS